MTIKNTNSTTKKLPVKLEIVNIVEASQLYTKEKDILLALQKTNKQVTDIQVEYQKIAVSLLQHLNKHQDTRIILNFFGKVNVLSTEQQALIDKDFKLAGIDKETAIYFPRSMFLESMTRFCEKYGQVSFKKVEIEGKKTTLPVFDKDKEFNLNAALSNAWWKTTTQNLNKIYSYNFIDAMEKELERAKKLAIKPKTEDDFVPLEFVNKIEMIIKDARHLMKRHENGKAIESVESVAKKVG